MADDFDPYYKWLGIRPKDQPPHHYRLLGIELFENDPDVIEQAADRQMAFLHTFKTGQHSALSQKLLNEVAAAKLCLLDAARRTDYDESLRARLAPANAAETAPSASAPARPPVQAPVRTTPTASPSIPIAAARPVVQAPVARQLPMGVAARVDERPRPNPKRLLMLTELTLDRAAITDAGLKNVATLHELTTLRLTNVPIGDAGLKHLRGLQHLKLLDLSRSQVAGPGLSQLRAPNLEELVLDGTKVSDRSMGFVGSLRGLRRISLEDTDIGDKGLLRLKTLKSLELVRTSGTRVTGGGILRFRQGKKVTVLEGRKNTVTPERQ